MAEVLPLLLRLYRNSGDATFVILILLTHLASVKRTYEIKIAKCELQS